MAEQRIKILPDTLTNKIAAGEVIDRPASVVKELVENSIDAGATRIEILLKEGGKQLIQVIDNGNGMSEADAPLALQRHTTSKISSYSDLEHITTLGFRGEALASISSVCRLELRTATSDASASTVVKCQGGKDLELDKAAPQQGSSISVKNLFFNTPARRKFLRTDETEYRHILNCVNRFTLAYPEIQFTLSHGNTVIFDYPSSSLDLRVAEVLGKRIGANLLPVSDRSSQITISGKAGNWEIVRKSRGDQYLFLNRRYIVDRSLAHAIVSAYAEIIPKGRFPVYVIFLEVDPERVDVNVHPTKTEVRFADQRLVYDLLRGCIKRALATPAVVPEIARTDTAPEAQRPPGESSQTSFDFSAIREREFRGRVHTELSVPDTVGGLRTPTFERANVWQLHDSYIVSEIKSGLIVIDQHIAHERVLYEKAIADFESAHPSSQQLLFPETVELSQEDHNILLEILPFLQKLGFIIKSFSKYTVVVEGVPAGARIGSEERVVLDIIDEYKNNRKAGTELRESVARAFSCRSAIKAGEKLSLESMNALIDQLFATQNPYFCPHGRPIIINISLEELNKRFQR